MSCRMQFDVILNAYIPGAPMQTTLTDVVDGIIAVLHNVRHHSQCLHFNYAKADYTD